MNFWFSSQLSLKKDINHCLKSRGFALVLLSWDAVRLAWFLSVWGTFNNFLQCGYAADRFFQPFCLKRSLLYFYSSRFLSYILFCLCAASMCMITGLCVHVCAECMYVCKCVRACYVCACKCGGQVCVYAWARVCMRVCMLTGLCVDACECVHMCRCEYMQVCTCMRECACMHACMHVRWYLVEVLCPSVMWVLGIELRLSSLAASSLYQCAIPYPMWYFTGFRSTVHYWVWQHTAIKR